MVERMTLNHVVVGSSPTVGESVNTHYMYTLLLALIVQWLEFAPSKHEVRVRFPVNACIFFFIIIIIIIIKKTKK